MALDLSERRTTPVMRTPMDRNVAMSAWREFDPSKESCELTQRAYCLLWSKKIRALMNLASTSVAACLHGYAGSFE